MRQLAAMVASPMNLASGGGCGENAKSILTTLNGIPH
jgi:hypothetical protein